MILFSMWLYTIFVRAVSLHLFIPICPYIMLISSRGSLHAVGLVSQFAIPVVVAVAVVFVQHSFRRRIRASLDSLSCTLGGQLCSQYAITCAHTGSSLYASLIIVIMAVCATFHCSPHITDSTYASTASPKYSSPEALESADMIKDLYSCFIPCQRRCCAQFLLDAFHGTLLGCVPYPYHVFI